MENEQSPEINSIWSSNDFKIQIIAKDDSRNKSPDGKYKRTGKVIYEYLTGPIGKIGNCKTIEGFYQCWDRG